MRRSKAPTPRALARTALALCMIATRVCTCRSFIALHRGRRPSPASRAIETSASCGALSLLLPLTSPARSVAQYHRGGVGSLARRRSRRAMPDIVPAGCALCASRANKDTMGSQQNLEAGINCNNDQINNSNKSNELQTRKQGRKGRRNRSQNRKKQPQGGGGRVRNSYLKIVMDDESVDLMHGIAQRLRQVVRQRFPDIAQDEEGSEISKVNMGTSDKDGDVADRGDSQPSKRQKPPRPLTFKPRSRNSLHMTFFFGGTTICEIPPEELVEWHGQVMTRLQQASGPIGRDAESGETESSRYTLLFRELCLFPPRRNTLIVAIFDGSPELHKLHNDLRDIAINSNSDGLKEVVKRSKERWTAHVTLGDLYGGGRGEAKQEKLEELAKMLQDGLGLDVIEEKEDMMHSSNLPTAKVKGIAMGGPVPSQVDLNWDYFF